MPAGCSTEVSVGSPVSNRSCFSSREDCSFSYQLLCMHMCREHVQSSVRFRPNCPQVPIILCSPCTNGSSFEGFNEWILHCSRAISLTRAQFSTPGMMIFVSLFNTLITGKFFTSTFMWTNGRSFFGSVASAGISCFCSIPFYNH